MLDGTNEMKTLKDLGFARTNREQYEDGQLVWEEVTFSKRIKNEAFMVIKFIGFYYTAYIQTREGIVKPLDIDEDLHKAIGLEWGNV